MFKLHEIDKVHDFCMFFIKNGKQLDLDKLVIMLFLLDLIHYFEIGRPATNLTYKKIRKNNLILFSVNRESELATMIAKESSHEAATKRPITFVRIDQPESYLKNFTKREYRILKKIISEWDSATLDRILNYLSKTFKIMTDREEQISFKDTLQSTDNTTYMNLKCIIEERENFLSKHKKLTPEDPHTPDAGLHKCNQAKS